MASLVHLLACKLTLCDSQTYLVIVKMSCNVCKTALAEGDRHFGCIRHRQCSRQSPCSLDMEEPPSYWDEVEDIIKAINVVSPERRSSRRVSAKGNADLGEGGVGVQVTINPPTLSAALLSKSNSKSVPLKNTGKKTKKVAAKKAHSKKSLETGEKNRVDAKPSPPRGPVQGIGCNRGVSRPDLPVQGEESGNFGSPNCTSIGGSAGRAVSGGAGKYIQPPAYNTESINRHSAELVSITTVSANDPGSNAIVGHTRPTGETSDQDGDRQQVQSPGDSGNDPPAVSGETGGRDRAENRYTGFSGLSTSLGTDTIPTVVGSTPGPDFRVPEVPDAGNRYTGFSRYPAVLGLSDSRVSSTFQTGQPCMAYPTPVMSTSQQRGPSLTSLGLPQPTFPVLTDTFGLSNPGQQATLPSHYGGMMGQWMQPWGMSAGWCPTPMPTVPPPSFIQQQVVSTATSIVTSQPASSVIQSQPSSAVTWSVPSRRGSVSSGAAAGPAARPPVHSVPLEDLSDIRSDHSGESDEVEEVDYLEASDEEISSLGAEADLFREDTIQSVAESLDPSQQTYYADTQDERDKKIFSKDRVDPIILSAAQLAGAEYLDNTVSTSTLLFGNSGLKRSDTSPILSMPPDVYEFRDQARKYKGSIGKTNALTTIFKVPEEDFRGLFRVPDMGSDVEAFLRKAPGTQTGYVKSWEAALKAIDRELRSLSRLSSFQLLIANAMAIHLSDSDNAAEKDSPFAMAKLAADLSARQTAMLMRLSTQTIRLRRNNVFASVLGLHKGKLVDALKALDIQDSSLFGDGGFAATIKQVAKDVTSERTLSTRLHTAGVSSGAGAGRGKGDSRAKQRAKSRVHPYANAEPRNQRRERNSNQSSMSFRSQGSSGGKSQSRGGRKQGRGGRGRGRPANKRF